MTGFNVNCKDCARCLEYKERLQTVYVCALSGWRIKDIEQNVDCYGFVKRRKNHL